MNRFTDFRADAAELPALYDAWWFDGQRAEARAARLHFDADTLVIESAEGAFIARRPLAQASISEVFAQAPRQLTYADGATLQVADAQGLFAQALAQHGYRESFAVRLQRWSAGVVLALALLITALYFGYTQGLPVAAQWVAENLPASVEQRIGRELLVAFDEHYLAPSRLDEDVRVTLQDRFAQAAHRAAPDIAYRLEFRSTLEGSGVNAFALPGGTIVLLDGLVNFADTDDQILAALGHELGHVAHRHGMRNVIASLGTGALASLVWGDFSGVAVHATTVLGVLEYSRDAEREADRYALMFLRANGLGARPLHGFLASVQTHLEHNHDAIPSFASTHPSLDERLDALVDEIEIDEGTRAPAAP